MDAMFSVIISKFQPPSVGHVELMREAISRSSRLILVVGSSDRHRSVSNPFSYQERKELLSAEVLSLGVKPNRYHILDVPDVPHSDHLWIAAVHEKVVSVTRGNMDLLLVGDFSEDTYYLKLFPQWKYHNVKVEMPNPLEQYFEDGSYSGVTDGVASFLEKFKGTVHYPYLLFEDTQETGEKEDFDLFIRSGHVLMTKRFGPPGAGTWSLVPAEMELFSGWDVAVNNMRANVVHCHIGALSVHNKNGNEWKPLHWVFANPSLLYSDTLSLIQKALVTVSCIK
jgi:bifunctional NMN adenylyltransferase/nudix hydrolase